MNSRNPRKKTLIIAEAGVNYNGDIELAKKMVDAAAEAGADIVKFQTGKPENSISVNAKKADYQEATTGTDESQLEMCKKLMLPDKDYPELVDYCNKKGIEFLSTPFDCESVDFLANLGVRKWKIPSGEITHLPLLVYIAKRGESVILSTGMSTIEEIRDALSVLTENGANDITVLQCNTEYPTPFEDANITAMNTLKKEFGCNIGYSDHTFGITAPIAAVALGATVIEKHFTLDRHMPGPDQSASLEPDELKTMVKMIRETELALGDGEKKPSDSELKNKDIARKSIVAKKSIKAGEIFSEENITCKRPGNGISPMKWNDIIGQTAKYDFEFDEQIRVD